MERDTRSRLFFILISLGLVLLPFLWVHYPPSSDLPQHVAQVRLFFEALDDPSGPYRIQWGAPNNLVYVLLGTGWAMGGPENAGRIALIFLAVLWTAEAAFLAARKGKPPETAVLVSVLVFNQSLYWGFFNFLVGWPVFILWFVLTTKKSDNPFRWKDFFLYAAVAFLLLQSHALWFALGTAWLVLYNLFRKTRAKAFAAKILGLLPCAIYSVLWYPTLSASRASAGFDTAAHWFQSPVERLFPTNLLNSVFGGLRGMTESVLFCGLAAWAGIALWENRSKLKDKIDRDLLLAACLLLGIAWLAPDKYMNTINFASRWLPCGLIMLLLAVPAPFAKPALRKLAAFGLLAAFTISTGLVWVRWEREEMSGLREALAAVPSTPRILGLDFVKESDLVKGRPFLQTFAYAQALKGGEVNFSFAEHASGIVAYKERRRVLWTPGLEWFAEKVKKTDFGYFDFALVNGNIDIHRILAGRKEITPVTLEGRWRLYRVVPAK